MMRPPSIRSITHRTSFSCELSELSPVMMSSETPRPVTGLTARAHPLHHLVHDLRRQPLLRSISAVDRRAQLIEEFDPERQFFVDHVRVGELRKARRTTRRTTRPAFAAANS